MSSSAELPRQQSQPGREITAAIECLAVANGRDHRGRNHRTDTWDRHDFGAILLGATDLFDLAETVSIRWSIHSQSPKRPNRMLRIRGDISSRRSSRILSFVQDPLERSLRRPDAWAHGDPLFYKECPDLVDRRGATRDKPRLNPMQGLKVDLVLGLLGNRAEVGAQRGFGDRLGIVVVVRWANDSLDHLLSRLTLPLVERLHVDRRYDVRMIPGQDKPTVGGSSRHIPLAELRARAWPMAGPNPIQTVVPSALRPL